MEGVLPSELAGSSHRENPLGEAFSRFGLIAKTKLPPLNRRPERRLGTIVRGLDTLVEKESEKVGPVFERPLGAGAHLSVGTLLVFEAIPFHASPDEHRGILELPAGDVALAESVPATEHVPGFLEHELGKQVGVRTAPAFLEPLELPDLVGPAKLSEPAFMIRL